VAIETDSALAWLRLSLTPGLTGTALRRLREALGAPTAIVASSRAALTQLVEPALADAIVRGPASGALNAALAWARAPQHRILVPDGPDYPALLHETADPPPVLYALGRSELFAKIAVAVVGSRNATAQGMKNAEAFARAFSEADCCVVSGLALGIDAAAHRGALAGRGSSIAILGNGIDIVYPRRNSELYDQLCTQGLVLSEFPLGTAPLAANFPRRNRLISAITRGCLVVEAAVPSGSLITARIAAELGRDVFAIPGSIHSPLSKGCHLLIKQGAKLVETAQDVLEEFNIPVSIRENKSTSTSNDPDVNAILDALGHDPCTIDALVARSQLSIDRVLSLLTELELRGQVSTLAGGRYLRIT
jgi:DNA processing protein